MDGAGEVIDHDGPIDPLVALVLAGLL
jgi:hypothetical protein